MIFARISRNRFGIALSALLCGTLFLPLACKSKEEGGATSSVAPTGAVDLSNTLVGHLPTNSVSFFEWDMTGPGYKKLSASQWASSESMFANLSSTSPETQKAADVLKRIGIDPTSRKDFDALMGSGIVFIAPAPNNPSDLGVGALIKSSPEAKLSDKMAAAKKELAASGTPVKDITVSGGAGFSFDTAVIAASVEPQAAAAGPTGEKRLFAAWSGQMLALGTSEPLVQTLLASKGDTLPAIVNSPDFKSSTQGFPGTQSRFGFGYLGVNDIAKTVFGLGAGPAGNAGGELPIRTVAAAFAMEETPQSEFRLTWRTENPNQKEWFAAFNSSSSSSILPAVPSNPLFLVSIDGATIKKLKELYIKAAGGTVDSQAQALLVAVDHLKRIGIAGRTAPVGQSFLPVPDLLIIAESDDPEALMKGFTDLGTIAMASSGMAAGETWQDTSINGVPAKAYRSQMGFGMFLAAQKNLVLAASTEAQLRGSIDIISGKSPGFASTLTDRAQAVLGNGNDVANLYCNFEQIAALLESLSGMLGMFAPQGGGENPAAQFLSQERLQQLRRMGSLVGTLTAGDELIALKSFYQVSAPGQQVASSR